MCGKLIVSRVLLAEKKLATDNEIEGIRAKEKKIEDRIETTV